MDRVASKLAHLRWYLESLHEQEAESPWVTTQSGGRLFVGKPKSMEDPGAKKIQKTQLKTRTRKDGSTYTRYEPTPEWLQKETEAKFARMAHLAQNIDAIHAKHTEHLEAEPGPTKKKAVATAAAIMRETGIRVGGGKSTSKPGKTRGAPTYGMTTLQKKHVKLDGDTATLDFVGKAGKQQTLTMQNAKIANALRDFLGGQDQSDSDEPLFSYREGNQTKTVTRKHVAAALKGFHKAYEAKDLRTLVANEIGSKEVEAILNEVHKLPDAPDKRRKLAQSLVHRVAKAVSKKLGNTPAVALTKYINPELIEHLLEAKGLKEAANLALRSLRALIENDDDPITQEYPTLVSLFGHEAVKALLHHHSQEDEDDADDPAKPPSEAQAAVAAAMLPR